MENTPLWIHPTNPIEMTANMRLLCEEYVRNGEVKTAAFTVAYPECKSTPQTRKNKITKVFKDERVHYYIKVLQTEVASVVVYGLADHVNKLIEIRDAAYQDGAWSAATMAEKAIGNATGHQTAQGSQQLDKHVAAPTLNIQRPDRSAPPKLKSVK